MTETPIIYRNLNIGKISTIELGEDFSYYHLMSSCVPANYHNYLPKEEHHIFSFQQHFNNFSEPKNVAILVFENYIKLLKNLVQNTENLVYERDNNQINARTDVGKFVEARKNDYGETTLVSIYFSEVITGNKKILLNTNDRLLYYGSKRLEKSAFFGNPFEYIDKFSKAHFKYFKALLKYVGEINN